MLYLKYTVFVGIRRNSPGRPVGSTPSEIVGLGGNSFSNYLEGGLGTVMRRLSVRKVSLTALVLVLVLSLSVVASAESFTLTILHTNDVHGRIFSYDHRELGENAGGYARRATLIEQIKAENPHTLVLDAGDLFSGTPVSSVYKGQADMIAAMLVGYDAITIGNHEFDYGQDVLKDYIDYLPIPILGANVVYEDGTPFAPSHVVFEVNGARVLVVGLVTTSTPVTTHPKNVVGLKFLDPVETTRRIMEEQAGEFDVFVVLSHLGADADVRLAERVPGIDAIIGGHSHTLIDEPLFVGDTIVAQVGDWGRYLGRVDLEIVDNEVVGATSSLIPVTGDIEPNPVVEAILQELYGERIAEEMARVVGYSPVELVRPSRGSGDTNLGNFVTDALLWDTGADIAIYNNGGIRTSLPAGDITLGDLYAIEPFGNMTMTVELTKEQMEALFDHMAALGGEQIAGGSYVVVDGKAQDIRVGGKPLEDRTYVVATNEFVAAGGDGYWMMAEGTNQQIYDVVRDTFVRFLEAHPDYVFESQGRITFGQ